MLTDLRCPECGGPIWERQEGPLLRFACRIGHSFGAESLAGSQAQALETALWSALNSLEERAELLTRMSRKAGEARRERYLAEAGSLSENAETVRQTLVELRGGASPSRVED